MGAAADRIHRGGLDHYQPGATLRHLSIGDQMPVVGKAVFRGVLTHRADGNPVAQRHAALGQRIKKGSSHVR